MGYQETIKRCGSKMQSVELLQGSTQHICHPLLSVFAGEDAGQEGMCAGPPEMDEVKMTHGSLEEQAADPYSIYQYVRKAIHLRETYPAVAVGKTGMNAELSGKEICVLTREAEGTEPVMLVINTLAEPVSIQLDQSDFGIEGAGQQEGTLTLTDMLCVSEEEVVYKNGELTLPAFAIAILK